MELMFGYELLEHDGYRYKIAEMEKAVLDYLYFNSNINNEESYKGLRFNVAEFKEKVDAEKFNKYLLAFSNEALTKRVKKFLTYIQHAWF